MSCNKMLSKGCYLDTNKVFCNLGTFTRQVAYEDVMSEALYLKNNFC